jgi:DUF971 family protein
MTDKVYPTPVTITLHKKSRTLEIEFDNQENIILSCALLRASSPSAEMRHDISSKHLDYSNVNILSIESVGNYAIKPVFSDGHRTGIFSWRMLYDLGKKSGR